MSNMSYCRFENTSNDLSDCLNALTPDNEYPISNGEQLHGMRMFKEFLDFCVETNIIEEYDEAQIEQVFNDHNNEVK